MKRLKNIWRRLTGKSYLTVVIRSGNVTRMYDGKLEDAPAWALKAVKELDDMAKEMRREFEAEMAKGLRP